MQNAVNYNELPTEKLQAIELVLETYLFKQPDFGEPWHPDYRKNKKSFDLLIRHSVLLARTLKSAFADLKKQVPDLVNTVLADDKQTARINRWIKKNFNTNADINLANKMSDDIFPMYTNGAQAASAQVKIPTRVSSTQAASQKALTKYTLNLAGDLNKTTVKNVTQAVQTSLDLGETKPEMTDRINEVLDDPVRAQMIAQTETVRAFTQGRLDAGRDMGYDEKTWVNGQPGACQVCQDLDGVTVGIDESFDTGSDSLGAVDGPPAHPNCKCGPPKLGNSQVKASEILGGWITKNGAHIFIDESAGASVPAVKTFENSTPSDGKEKVAVFTPDGKTVFTKTGGAHSVSFNKDQADDLKGNIMTHNHPNDSLDFSQADLWTGVKGQALEIRAFNSDRVISLTYPKGFDFDKAVSHFSSDFNKSAALFHSRLVPNASVAANYADIIGAKFQMYPLRTFAVNAQEPVIDRLGRVIRAGWITTAAGNHVYIDDTGSPDGKGRVVPQKSIADLQEEHERAMGLGQLSDFNNAFNSKDYPAVQKIGQQILQAPANSPLADYKSAVTHIMSMHDGMSSERDAINFSKDSTIKDTLYHGASDDSLANIEMNGFKTDSEGYFGNAVYFTQDKADAFMYGTNVVSAKVNVGVVKTIDSMDDLASEAQALGISTDGIKDQITRTYDALRVKDLGYVAVFNPKNTAAFAVEKTQ